MAITINRGTVKRFVTAARKALRMPGKSICAARCVISRDSDGLTLHAASRSDDISLHLPGDGGADCLVYLQGDELASLAGKVSESAEITFGDHRATITWANGSAKCQMDVSAEPFAWDTSTTATWPVPGLLDAIHRAETCCDTESTRYALSGWLVTAEEGRASDIVATDSRQLLCQYGVIPADTIARSVIVPAIGIRSIFGRRFDDLEIGQQDSGRVVLAGDGWQIRLDGLDGRFPRYDAVIRDSHNTVLSLAPADCEPANTWDTTTGDDETLKVQLNGHLQTVDGDYTYQMHPATKYTGGELDLTLRSRYWHRGTALQPESVGFAGNSSAVVFQAPGATYVAMPLTDD